MGHVAPLRLLEISPPTKPDKHNLGWQERFACGPTLSKGEKRKEGTAAASVEHTYPFRRCYRPREERPVTMCRRRHTTVGGLFLARKCEIFDVRALDIYPFSFEENRAAMNIAPSKERGNNGESSNEERERAC